MGNTRRGAATVNRRAHGPAAEYAAPCCDRGVALDHSREMAVNGYIGHGTTNGESFLARLVQAVPRGSRAGENVAAGVDAERIHAAFIHSPGHVQNLPNPRFARVGIGEATVDEFLIATEDFAE